MAAVRVDRLAELDRLTLAAVPLVGEGGERSFATAPTRLRRPSAEILADHHALAMVSKFPIGGERGFAWPGADAEYIDLRIPDNDGVLIAKVVKVCKPSLSEEVSDAGLACVGGHRARRRDGASIPSAAIGVDPRGIIAS